MKRLQWADGGVPSGISQEANLDRHNKLEALVQRWQKEIGDKHRQF